MEQDVFVKHQGPHNGQFFETVTTIFALDFDSLTKERVFPKEHICEI